MQLELILKMGDCIPIGYFPLSSVFWVFKKF